jgi:putative membrane protein
MDLQYIIASLHLVTFAIGVASCWGRARALARLKDRAGLKEVFVADNIWGIAALLWIGTGLWRAFGGLEKGTAYYLGDMAFLIKMSLFIVVFLLEIFPMITLIKWRIRQGRGLEVDISRAKTMAQISFLQLLLLIPIAMMATAMARGIWY